MDRSKNITLAIVATIFMFATMAFGADNNAASTLQEELNDSIVPAQTIDEEEFLCYPPLMPEYPGGNDALLKLISDNIRLPKCVKSGEVSGTSVISFMVQPSGKCDRFKVVRSLNKECDAEAIRVLKNMATWKPGEKYKVATKRYEPVGVLFTIPVQFKNKK